MNGAQLLDGERLGNELERERGSIEIGACLVERRLEDLRVIEGERFFARELRDAEPSRARGVAVQGSTVYWGNGDFKFDDAGYKGGVWECTLPACADKKLVAAGDWAASPIARGGHLYFAETNGTGTISRVTVPG
ncbi:hypothetical protein, partial [Escherichia coli]|uniref:hypothetical protein n=1 Tax=Escherichia coli TaxID=562 RepID=UPI00159BD6D5